MVLFAPRLGLIYSSLMFQSVLQFQCVLVGYGLFCIFSVILRGFWQVVCSLGVTCRMVKIEGLHPAIIDWPLTEIGITVKRKHSDITFCYSWSLVIWYQTGAPSQIVKQLYCNSGTACQRVPFGDKLIFLNVFNHDSFSVDCLCVGLMYNSYLRSVAPEGGTYLLSF